MIFRQESNESIFNNVQNDWEEGYTVDNSRKITEFKQEIMRISLNIIVLDMQRLRWT